LRGPKGRGNLFCYRQRALIPSETGFVFFERFFFAPNRGFEKNLRFPRKNGKKGVNLLPLSIAILNRRAGQAPKSRISGLKSAVK
jgi:hypothetical protein